LITTFADGAEVQEEELVTVKVYVPGSRLDIVTVAPLPVVVIPPGFLVRVHESVGSELSTTLPVATAHVGWVIVPMAGAEGVGGCALIVTGEDAGDVQPFDPVTVKV
jgi:hypothetical protein